MYFWRGNRSAPGMPSPVMSSTLLASSLFLSSMFLSSMFCSSLSLAAEIDTNRLWLPRAQQELKPELVQAAQLTATTPECAEVISGELATNRGTDKAPVFLVVCRNPAGYTYSVYVTNAGKPNAKVEKAQGSAVGGGTGNVSAAKDESTAVDDKTADKNCLAALKQRTAHMAGIQLDESSLQRLESAAGETQYEMDFDAADPSGMTLHFHAVCRVAANGTALVDVKPRHVEQALSTPKPAASKPAESESQAPASTEPQSTEPKTTDPKTTGDDGWEVVQ